jgi:hypothetical protein
VAGSIESRIAAGHQFEDEVSEVVFRFKRTLNLQVFPPRVTLADYPTFSGLAHQFDVAFVRENGLYLIECKRKTKVPVEQLFAFNAKVLDYCIGFASSRVRRLDIYAMFLSTEVDSGGSLIRYAIAYGILPIIKGPPPPQKMLLALKPGSRLEKGLAELEQRLFPQQPLIAIHAHQRRPDHILTNWESHFRRWCQEGYQ